MAEHISFDLLPQIVNQLVEEVKSLKKVILERQHEHQPNSPIWFDLPQLCEYLPDKPSRATAYRWTSAKAIPFHKSQGRKKLRFSKAEIDTWLQQGRKKTMSEISEDAFSYIKPKKS